MTWDQDGLVDLVVLIPYEKVKIPAPGFRTRISRSWMWPCPAAPWSNRGASAADIDGDGKAELLLTQKNFLRAVVLRSEASLQSSTNRGGWTFTVKEQINGASSNSRLAGAAANAEWHETR
jgi:hypothetical protein